MYIGSKRLYKPNPRKEDHKAQTLENRPDHLYRLSYSFPTIRDRLLHRFHCRDEHLSREPVHHALDLRAFQMAASQKVENHHVQTSGALSSFSLLLQTTN